MSRKRPSTKKPSPDVDQLTADYHHLRGRLLEAENELRLQDADRASLREYVYELERTTTRDRRVNYALMLASAVVGAVAWLVMR